MPTKFLRTIVEGLIGGFILAACVGAYWLIWKHGDAVMVVVIIVLSMLAVVSLVSKATHRGGFTGQDGTRYGGQ